VLIFSSINIAYKATDDGKCADLDISQATPFTADLKIFPPIHSNIQYDACSYLLT